jgi:zona occludens toxin (predicted ATPase)
MAKIIRDSLRRKRNVISTVDIKLDLVTKNGKYEIGKFDYVPIEELTPDYLYRYFAQNHEKGKERQTLIFIDECQIIFNTREWQAKERMAWILFFTRHRHLGYEPYLITQNDTMIDKQIRAVVEIEIVHKKLNNLFWFIPFLVFLRVERWYCNKQKIRHEAILFRYSIAQIYDSYQMYDEYFEMYKPKAEANAADAEAKPEELTDSDDDAACEVRAGRGGIRKERRAGLLSMLFKMQPIDCVTQE